MRRATIYIVYSNSYLCIYQLLLICQQLDPILAQGAGVAVEEAALLASCLSRLPLADRSSLSDRLKEYESLRATRIKTRHRLSQWSQSVGHVSTRGIANVRDKMAALINSTPPTRFVAEMVFDKAVDAAAESEVYKVLR